MNAKSELFTILSIFLLSSIGILTIDTAFAQDSEDDRKEQETKSQKNEEKRKELEEKKSERQNELESKKQDLEEKRIKNEKTTEEKRREIEKKREELESDRENLTENLSERTEKYEEKLREIKEKYQKKIDDLSEKNLQSLKKSEERKEKLEENSEKIQERLKAKSETLDSRTQKILEKIDDGDYMGKKLGSSETTNTYELVFDSVSASAISNKSETSTMNGKMIFTTYDSSKSNLKLELESCSISVGSIPYVCGYGKARTTSSGDSGAKNSLVIIAFLEDNLAEELHSTLKIFLDSDIPINQIEQSEVSVLGPHSKLSHLWFIDGTATLTKIVTDITDDATGNEITVELSETVVDITGN